MKKRELAPTLPKKELEHSEELLRVWIRAGMPCLTINLDLFSDATTSYGMLLGNITQHQANALAEGKKNKQKVIFNVMRTEIRRILQGPIGWPLGPYRKYTVESGAGLPIPPFAANDDNAFEVVRAWLCGPVAGGELQVSLLPAPDAMTAAEFCVTLMRLIAREIHKKTGADETATLETLKKAFSDELEMKSDITGGMMGEADQTADDGLLSKLLKKLGW